MPPVLGLVLAYLLGSIPFAYLAGRLLKGIDLRQHGSGNLGATNVYRTLGWQVAVVVLLLDAAKGFVPAFVFPRLVDSPWAAHWAIAYGIAAILGHVRSIFLLWRGGGKGVATAAGVFFALAPLATLVALVAWLGVAFASRYVSLASLSAAIVLPVAVAAWQGVHSPVLPVALLVCAFVFWTHRANIGRLRRGEEHRLGERRAV